jgi:hypothetical protein
METYFDPELVALLDEDGLALVVLIKQVMSGDACDVLVTTSDGFSVIYLLDT